MKFVRLENNTVHEIIPASAAIPSISYWYGEAFAAQCFEAPDEVGQHWVYDPESDTWSEPTEPEEPGPDPGQDDSAEAAQHGLMWLLAEGEIAEKLNADQIITNETAFEEWGEELAQI